jgi:hypothetical protein
MEDPVDEVAKAAEAAGMTVDEWLDERIEDRVALLEMRKAIDEFEAENGAFTEEELEDARAWLADIRARQRQLRATSRDAS